MTRILGIDYGEVRTGLALSDEGKQFAFEFETWPTQQFFEKIPALVQEKEIERAVIGLPMNMDAEDTKKTQEIREFADHFAKAVPNVPIDYVDERLTTVMAAQALAESGQKNTGKNLDSLAAQMILQMYLNLNAHFGSAAAPGQTDTGNA